ncbi:MAG TPA: PQQ-dependent sugar dehydrogenase [Xanthomonadales bacterium]|nr:PQQ-dependent sugar dehydrogenase [Xanthomonadales bacterium]
MKLQQILIAVLLVASAPSQAQETRYELHGVAGPYVVEQLVNGFSQPIAIEFLPDGKALVAQRNLGVITRVDFRNGERVDIAAMPGEFKVSDAGLHDVELHPDYTHTGWIYITYSEGDPHYSTLVIDRIRLDGDKIRDRERIFTADAYAETLYHYGGRMQFLEGYLYVSVGDRQHPERAQDRSNHTGSILRLHDDGRVPVDNPFVGLEDEAKPVRPEIWSYGHRNPQGLYVNPQTGELWSSEHGPRGGDEVNRIVKGANYGWAEISFGFEYEGGPIGKGIVSQEGMQQPVWVYVPSIAPSDLVFYQGEAFPAWRGSWLIGALALTHLNRLALQDGAVVLEERLVNGLLGRIRSIAVDSAGLVYLGSDLGGIWRLRPL